MTAEATRKPGLYTLLRLVTGESVIGIAVGIRTRTPTPTRTIDYFAIETPDEGTRLIPIADIVDHSALPNRTRLVVLAGPCGVGKSTIGARLADCLGHRHVEFDDERSRRDDLAFSLSRLDLFGCIADLCGDYGPRYVLDLGGDTLFRNHHNHREQVQILEYLQRRHSKIILLTCDREELQRRFIRLPGRTEEEFTKLYAEWRKGPEPAWRELADAVADTSGRTPEAIVADLTQLVTSTSSTKAGAA